MYECDLYTFIIYLGPLLLSILLCTVKKDGHDRLHELYSDATLISFRKVVHRSAPIAIIRTLMSKKDRGNRLLDKIGVNVVKGLRGSRLTSSLDKIKGQYAYFHALKLMCDDNIETGEEEVEVMLNSYKLNLINLYRKTDIYLTIVLVLCAFIPILGLVINFFMKSYVIALIMLLIQIVLLEVIGRVGRIR
ncbi:MAG: hypothetical protein QXH96_01355 [Candidatus Geothermarchaeota archaeon]